MKLDKQTIKQATIATSGMSFAVAVGIGALIGYYLDKWLKTSPWMLILWIGFGIAAGMKNIYDAFKLAAESDEKNGKDRNKGTGV